MTPNGREDVASRDPCFHGDYSGQSRALWWGVLLYGRVLEAPWHFFLSSLGAVRNVGRCPTLYVIYGMACLREVRWLGLRGPPSSPLSHPHSVFFFRAARCVRGFLLHFNPFDRIRFDSNRFGANRPHLVQKEKETGFFRSLSPVSLVLLLSRMKGSKIDGNARKQAKRKGWEEKIYHERWM